MEKLFTTGKVKGIDANTRTLTAYASTGAVDRQNEVILPEAWRKTIQEQPSVPLVWGHEYSIPPLGRVSAMEVDGIGLKFQAQFANTPFANEIWSLYEGGFLDSFSVGFRPLKWQDGTLPGEPSRTYTEAELLEVSGVVVAANPFARVARGVPVISFKTFESFTPLETEQDEPTEAGLDTVVTAARPTAAQTAQGQTHETTAATVVADADAGTQEDTEPEVDAAFVAHLAQLLASVMDYLREDES